MFAMVLVIGIVVDDAIVVAGNAERIMAEEGFIAQGSHAQGDGADFWRSSGHYGDFGGGVFAAIVPYGRNG